MIVQHREGLKFIATVQWNGDSTTKDCFFSQCMKYTIKYVSKRLNFRDDYDS